MGSSAGRVIPLSIYRRAIGDLLAASHGIPSIPVQRTMDVGPLIELRRALTPRPSWCAIFCRAYAIVCQRRPQLRQSYLPYPWPRLYENDRSVAYIAVERTIGEEHAVLFGRISRVDTENVQKIHQMVERLRTRPVEQENTFRHTLRVARLPIVLRRLLWNLALKWRGGWRSRFVGTFGCSVYSSLGAESLHPIAPLTTTLNYGMIGEDGRLPVRITYDHRVMDGADIARALGELQDVLLGEVAEEMRQLAANGSAAA